MSLLAIIPAKDETDRIGATVRAVRALGAEVIVVDDGSGDDTAEQAGAAGAQVVRHRRNQGKGAALTTGLTAAGFSADRTPGTVLFVDADLGDSAAALAALVEPVLAGAADMTIATLPPQGAGGGHGFVVRLARRGIVRLTGWQATQPLSGMRCLGPRALHYGLPLAAGWGVEVGLTVDVLRAGLEVREVPCGLQHRVTGSDWRGQVHRAAQYRDVARALVARGWPVRSTPPPLAGGERGRPAPIEPPADQR